MKKIMMISQPMKGLSEEEITESRNVGIAFAKQHGFQIADTHFKEEWKNKDSDNLSDVKNIPLHFLTKSLTKMAKCDAIYFAKGYSKARGCLAEHHIADAYNLKIYYEDPLEELSTNVLIADLNDGSLRAELCTDPDYPGIDIEYIAHDDTGESTRPRVLIEQPINPNTNNQDELRVLIWSDPKSEDYTNEVVFK